MKVCTDSCIFGALTGQEIASRIFQENSNVLDLGAGTGLLSLMLAQRLPNARIVGIESHAGSAADCRDNFMNSAWSDRLRILEGDFKEISEHFSEKFDFIISNPPFFLSHLTSPESSRNSAMHASIAELTHWIAFMRDHIMPQGKIWMLLSSDSADKASNLILSQNLFIQKRTRLIRDSTFIWREILEISFVKPQAYEEENLLVLDCSGRLNEFGYRLLNDFYR